MAVRVCFSPVPPTDDVIALPPGAWCGHGGIHPGPGRRGGKVTPLVPNRGSGGSAGRVPRRQETGAEGAAPAGAHPARCTSHPTESSLHALGPRAPDAIAQTLRPRMRDVK